MNTNSKVAIFDIDGVMNYYPDCWVRFVEAIKGEKYNDLNEMKEKLSYAEYKRLKHQYRISGVKEDLKVRDGLLNLVNNLRGMGYVIVIVSSRPVVKYPELYGQSTRWLDANGIKYDNIIFTSTKQYDIIKSYPNFSFIIDDNRLIVNLVSELTNKPAFLLSNEYNAGEISKNVKRIERLDEVWKEMKKN